MQIQSRPTPHGSKIYYSEACAMEVTHLGKGVTVHTCWGVLPGSYVDVVIADGEQLMKEHGRAVYLVDTLDSPRIETEFREKITAWFRAGGAKTTAHLLLKSKLIEMALNVANLVLGRSAVRAYARVTEWEELGRRESGAVTFIRRPIRWTPEVKRAVQGAERMAER